MADIDVVPKHGSKAWIWVVVAIIIALVIWAIVAHSGTRTGQLQVHPGFLAHVLTSAATLAAA